MKILGITAEYNPFHNGHAYHLEESRNQAQPDYIVAVMSGDFVQRGELALLNKWHRSRMAVEQGIDLVLELPFLYACNRAEIFAQGAVDILAGIGADFISFGSESGDTEALQTLAKSLQEQQEPLAELRAEEMKRGCSYAKGNQLAVRKLLGEDAEALILQPNNILAVEYLKRMEYWGQQGVSMTPITVKRHGSGYREKNEDSGYAGASVIRRQLRTGAWQQQDAASDPGIYLPESVWGELKTSNWSEALESREVRFFHLLQAEIIKSDPNEMARVYCLGEGLEYKLKKEIVKAHTLQELVDSMVSRRYPEAAIRRILVYLLLGVKREDPMMKPYGRVLAAGAKGRELLRMLKKQEKASIPILTNLNKELHRYPELNETIRYDILASDMYHLLTGEDLYRWSDRVVPVYMGK